MTDATEDKADLIAPEEARRRIEERHPVVLDVRNAQSRTEHGQVIEGAIPVDRDDLDTVLGPESADRIDSIGDLDTEIVVYCGTELGSQPVVDWLSEAGYRNVAHIEGGIRGWIAADQPTVDEA